MASNAIIARDDPASADVRLLIAAHLQFAQLESPPEAVHALAAPALAADGIEFFSARAASGELLGIAALRQLDALHAEIKSMHTAQGARGRGVGRAMLDHLLGVARGRGCTRVSLETGTMAAFAPARALYESAGFEVCPPFGPYTANPHSVCLSRTFG